MSVAAREVELKFLCTARDLDRALAAAPAGRDETRRLVSTYFDTAKGDLREAGVSLRVREAAGRRVQTLKRGEGVDREEHEAPLDADTPDIALGPLRDLLSDHAHRTLKPAFRVDVTRRQRLVRFEDAEIELAADEGEIRDGAVSAPVCELELELKSGSPRALFNLARRLAPVAGLYLSFEGKAAQGQALMNGGGVEARRKGRLRLAADAVAGQALQAWGRDCLAQLAANGAILRRVDEPAAVHQLRVAVRRLRSARGVYRPILGDDDGTWLARELKWLAKACDAARNLDVYYAEVVGPAMHDDPAPRGLDQLFEAVELARAAAYDEVLDAVTSARFRTLSLELAAWIETGAWRDGPAAGQPARAFAAEVLERARRKLLKRGRGLDRLDDEARHEVRIRAKRLRYAVEGFGPLFDRKATDRFVDRLRPLQDNLGALNDMATAEGLVERLALDPAGAYAAGRLAGVRSGQRPGLVARAARNLSRLAKAEPFWRG